jgi:TPP-dependent pyruvate/acetoin dehydrogenase alpha subunit
MGSVRLQDTRSTYQNPIVLLYIVNQQYAVSFAVALKRIQYLGINLTKKAQACTMQTINHC